MKLFNYIFYRICSFYQKKELDKTNPEIYASALISMMQLSVLMFLLSITNLFKLHNKKEFMLFFVPFIVVMIINGLFVFTKKRYKEIEKQWKQENRKNRYIKGILIVFWIILIFPFIIGSIYFFGS